MENGANIEDFRIGQSVKVEMINGEVVEGVVKLIDGFHDLITIKVNGNIQGTIHIKHVIK